MGCETQELANLLHKATNTENYDIHLLPLGRVRAGGQGGPNLSVQHCTRCQVRVGEVNSTACHAWNDPPVGL